MRMIPSVLGGMIGAAGRWLALTAGTLRFICNIQNSMQFSYNRNLEQTWTVVAPWRRPSFSLFSEKVVIIVEQLYRITL